MATWSSVAAVSCESAELERLLILLLLEKPKRGVWVELLSELRWRTLLRTVTSISLTLSRFRLRLVTFVQNVPVDRLLQHETKELTCKEIPSSLAANSKDVVSLKQKSLSRVRQLDNLLSSLLRQIGIGSSPLMDNSL